MAGTVGGGAWIEKARENSGRLILLGAIELIIGVVAIMAPGLTGVAVTLMVGVLLMLGGFARVLASIKAASFGAGALGILAGGFAIIAGVVAIASPRVGLDALTLILAFYFFVDGTTRLAMGFTMKPASGWSWKAFGGVLSLILGMLILAEWPVSGTWAIGVLVGIHFIFTGLSLIVIGISAKKATSAAA
jgi:uncharacterized membrane protein HdeD (DUF308 family)